MTAAPIKVRRIQFDGGYALVVIQAGKGRVLFTEAEAKKLSAKLLKAAVKRARR